MKGGPPGVPGGPRKCLAGPCGPGLALTDDASRWLALLEVFRRRVVKEVSHEHPEGMGSLDGPHPLSSKLQLRLPIRLARALRIEAGDLFYWRVSDEDPGTLQLLPAEVVERRYSAGEQMEASAREVARELGHVGEVDA